MGSNAARLYKKRVVCPTKPFTSLALGSLGDSGVDYPVCRSYGVGDNRTAPALRLSAVPPTRGGHTCEGQLALACSTAVTRPSIGVPGGRVRRARIAPRSRADRPCV